MHYSIEYFHARVLAEIESWPDGILADYARILEMLMEFGPNLRMPHSRAMGGVFLKYGHGAEKEYDAHFIVLLSDSESSSCMHLSKKHELLRSRN